jgi:hypothetical protein
LEKYAYKRVRYSQIRPGYKKEKQNENKTKTKQKQNNKESIKHE